jgi:hypothetical protein
VTELLIVLLGEIVSELVELIEAEGEAEVVRELVKELHNPRVVSQLAWLVS